MSGTTQATTPGLVGIEEHWTFDGIDAALRAQPLGLRDESLALNDHGGARGRLADVDADRMATMDAQGVALQVLSLAPPGAQGLSRADAAVLSREANDAAASIVSAHPDRFRAMATLPLADPASAAGELERASTRGLTGAMVYGRTGDILLDDPRFDDLWAVAARLRQPIFIHPQIPPASVRAASYSGFGDIADLALATFGWGWHLEAGTAALRLMTRGVLDRHPDLQLVLGHWGELLLFWHQRADGLARAAGLERSITEYLQQNVWITASGMLDPAMLHHALAVTTPDRILFSTDYPFQLPTSDEIEVFLDALPDETARDAFASGNARALFGIG
ncbi:putative TIM-barrel fold metal-dependent hydrolase [Leifsonia sp. 563]|uniref:amidohydrolase family protein n=1 Tax=Leifsonia sp. 563 TaxID=3156412 RepID=UPI00339A9BD9